MDIATRFASVTRRKRIAVALAIAVLLYAATGFLLLPYLARTKLPSLLADTIGRPVTIESVAFNPFALKLAVNGFQVDDSDGQPLVSLRELVVNVQSSSIFRRALTFKEIRLASPSVRLRVLPDGRLSFADMIEKLSAGDDAPPPDPDAEPFPVIVQRATIEAGRIQFRDESRRTVFEEEIAPIDIVLNDFATRPDKDSQYSFTAVTESGASVTWQGTLTAVPLRSTGEIRVAEFRSRTPWRYLHDNLRFEIVSGTANVSARYAFDGSAEPPMLEVRDGLVQFQNIVVFEEGTDKPAILLPGLVASGAAFDLASRHVRLRSLKSDGARLIIVRESDGRLRLQRILAGRAEPPTTAEATSPPAAPADPSELAATKPEWKVTVDEIRLTNYGIDFNDQSTPTPARLVIAPMSLDIDHLSTASSEPARLKLVAAFEPAGKLTSEGTLALEPLAANITVTLDDFGVAVAQPYVAQASGAVLRDGRLSTDLSIALATSAEGRMSVTLDGDVGLASLAVATRDGGDVLHLGGLAVGGLKVALDPTAVAITTVELVEPKIRVARRADGTTNLAAMGSAEAAAPAPAPASQAATAVEPPPPAPAASEVPKKATDVAISTIKIRNGSVVVTDAALASPFTLALDELTGEIRGFASRPDARVDVDFKSRVQRTGKLDLDATLTPLAETPDGKLHLVLVNMDLMGFSPYSEKYVGQQISRGKLGLDLDYDIRRAKLVALNKIELDKLTLGKRVKSADATELPVGLALALLRDARGKIALDVPVSGRLDDPAFRVGGVIVKTMQNLILKTATAPFALLGGLVGGGGDELGRIAFTPGRAEIAESEAAKLDSLARALTERPALNLEIAGATAAEADSAALGELTLENRLKAMRYGEIRERSDAPGSAAEVELSERHYERLLVEAYEAESGKRVRDLRREAPSPAPGEPELDRDVWVRTEMKRRLIASLEIGEKKLTELAGKRADAIARHLVETAKLPSERVTVIDPGGEASVEGDAVVIELALVPS